jgi:peptidoglycan-associated lipoprotein
MNNMNKLLVITMSVFSLALSGCSSSSKKSSNKSGIDGAERTGSQGMQVEVIGVNKSGSLSGQDINGSGKEVSPSDLVKEIKPVVYFNYDQFTVDDEGIANIKYYAKILVENPKEFINLVGHTDGRGSPEYNLALGERRAKAVMQVFMLYGVSSSRIDIVTYGEERPAVHGTTENAWRQNRRVELKISKY